MELENLKYSSNLAASRFQWGNAALSALGAANILQKRGPASQGFSLLGAVQLSTLAPTLRTRVLLAQAECAWVAGDHSQVARLAELVLSEERTDAQTRGRAWRLLGEAQVMACDNEAAMASLEHALCERTGGSATSDRVKALRTTGNLLVRQGKLDEALRRYTQAMNLLRRNPDRHAKGLMQVNLGVLASRRGKGDVALAHYRDAVQSLKGSGDAMVLGVALSNLGGLLSNQGKLEEALVHLEHALRLHSNAGARGRQVAALLMVGPVYWSAGDSESGYARAHRALALAEQLDAPLHLGNAHRILATFHQHLEQALVAYRRAGLQLWEHIWELSMGSLLLAEDQVASALTHFVSGLAGLNENSVGWLTALGGRAECRARLNQPEQAIADFDQAMAGSLGYPELSAELCLGRARVSSQLGESSEHWLAEAESYATQLGWSEKSPMRTQIDTMR